MIRQTPGGKLLHDVQNRGVSAWMLSVALIFFYVVLYFGYDTCGDDSRAVGGECAREVSRFEAMQTWLYDHFTQHLDTLGGTIFGPIAANFHGWTATAISLACVFAGGAYLTWVFREDGPKRNGAVAATALAGIGMYAFTRYFFTGDIAQLGPDSFSRWSVYGLLYTLAIGLGGIYVSFKYRHNKYQVVRTLVVMFIQMSFAFSIPILLKFFSHPEYYFSYLWPLKFDALNPNNFAYYGEVLVLYGFFASFALVPFMTLLYGKRWYCSWVCGCGGLANTFGEPWRHLADKSALSWKIEKVTIHTVLVLAVFGTVLWFVTAVLPDSDHVVAFSGTYHKYYGLIVVAALSGAIGTGLYPIGGTRVWCRFFCPMAALLGLIQKFGRFRIRVKRDMCISCGLCTTYCEMGIDVRAYAQANESFTRASCVGCGLCAEVCPRGVLRLENRTKKDPQELNWSTLVSESWKGNDSRIDTRS
ncbi:MAG: polyferredoxin [Bradymonadia bacterium]|jgi:polyferredoxin